MNLAGFTMPATGSRDTGEEGCSPALMQVRVNGRLILGK
jgi:hypothetical protein